MKKNSVAPMMLYSLIPALVCPRHFKHTRTVPFFCVIHLIGTVCVGDSLIHLSLILENEVFTLILEMAFLPMILGNVSFEK